MKVGASYYPELSSRPTWLADLTVARDLGLRALRCGEFAWGRFSPKPGQWDDKWALEFLDLAHKMDFDVVWCTPTATPPPYLFDRWPDLFAVNCDGIRMPIAVRRHYCPSHEGYLELSGKVAAKLAKSLGVHPAITGWQVDNEIAGDGFTCWCPRCGQKFQHWLEEKYGSLEALNEKWKAMLWSGRYTRWGQIPIPHRNNISFPPALKLAWREFRSNNWLEFYRRQADALHAAGVKPPVTTNFYNLEWDIPFDRWAWRPYLDAVALSHYVEDPVGTAFELSLSRGWGDKKLWVLEQKAGQQNAQNLYPESLSRLEVHMRRCAQGGADYAIYWHLRQHQAGCEMEHGAVLRHDGKATRVGHAIQKAIKRTAKVVAIPLIKQHALVFDFRQQWAQGNRPQPGTVWDYRKTVERDWFGALQGLVPGFVVSSFADALRQAEVAYAPHYQMAAESDLSAIRAFVKRGGVFVTTADFGRLDPYNNVLSQAPLAAAESFGKVPEGEMLHLKTDFSVTGVVGKKSVSGRYFWFVPEEGKSRSHLRNSEFSGPAFLEFPFGKGRLIIFLSAFDRPSIAVLLSSLKLL